jgi:hypothetical protein
VSFLFIWLSFVSSSDEYLRNLMFWHILASILLLGLLLASPLLPAFPNVTVRAVVSGSRSIPCFGIFCCYIITFMRKNVLFSFLMSVAFFLLTIGPWIVIQKYFVANPDLFDTAGDITRLVGLVVLLIAVIIG